MMDQVENGFAIDGAAVGGATPADDAQGAAGEVVIATDDPAVETGEGQQVEQAEGAATPPASNPPADGAKPSQKEIDAALGRRLYDERRKIEQSEEYRLGALLLDERARRDGISKAEAFNRIQQERENELAAAYAKDPTRFYKDYLSHQRRTQPEPTQETPEMQAQRIGAELGDLQRQGALPAGFDLNTSLDQELYNNMVRYGVGAALKIWEANHATAAELQRRQNGPAPMRPTSGRGQQSGPVDFTKMSKDQFKRIEEQVRNAEMSGKVVRFG